MLWISLSPEPKRERREAPKKLHEEDADPCKVKYNFESENDYRTCQETLPPQQGGSKCATETSRSLFNTNRFSKNRNLSETGLREFFAASVKAYSIQRREHNPVVEHERLGCEEGRRKFVVCTNKSAIFLFYPCNKGAVYLETIRTAKNVEYCRVCESARSRREQI